MLHQTREESIFSGIMFDVVWKTMTSDREEDNRIVISGHPKKT